MEKKIEDYLHLYLGCEVMGTEPAWGESRKGYLTGIHGEYEAEIQFFEEDGVNVSESPAYNKFTQVKPILRPLSSMTQEEADDYNKKSATRFSLDYFRDQVMEEAEVTRYLLSKHFDLFGLIDAGLAIPKPD